MNEKFDDRHYRQEKCPFLKKRFKFWNWQIKITAIVSKEDIETEKEVYGVMLENHGNYIAENAMIIPAKIAGAEGGDLYGIRMENAAIIRKEAREIVTNCTGLKMYRFKETEYLELLRKEVMEIQPIFAE